MDYLFLVLALLFVACVWGYRSLMKRGTDKFYKMMEDLNKQHGTSFGTTREDVHTVLGTNALFGIMAFDQKNRRIAYVTKSGKSIEILDFSYIRAWNTKWDENTVAKTSPSAFGLGSRSESNTRISNIVLEIGTNDLKRPIIKIRVPSIPYAEQWSSRLDILLNGR